jgi:hypothetical protein
MEWGGEPMFLKKTNTGSSREKRRMADKGHVKLLGAAVSPFAVLARMALEQSN